MNNLSATEYLLLKLFCDNKIRAISWEHFQDEMELITEENTDPIIFHLMECMLDSYRKGEILFLPPEEGLPLEELSGVN